MDDTESIAKAMKLLLDFISCHEHHPRSPAEMDRIERAMQIVELAEHRPFQSAVAKED